MRVRFAQRYLCVLFICALSAFTYICLKPESRISVFLFLPISVIGFGTLIFGFTIMGSASKKRAQIRANRACGYPASPTTSITGISTGFNSDTKATPAPASTTSLVDNTVAQTADRATETFTDSSEPPSPLATSAPVPRRDFAAFFRTADPKILQNFIETAATLPEHQHIAILWNRAFNDGYGNGRIDSHKNGLATGFNKGYKEGFEEGKKYMDRNTSLHHVVTISESTGTQTDEIGYPQLPQPPTFETCTQTTPPAPTQDAGSQYEPPPSIFDATSSPRPQLVAASSPASTVVASKTNTGPRTIPSPVTIVDTPHASPSTVPILNTAKPDNSLPKTSKSGPFSQYFTLPHTFRADPSRIQLNPTKFRPYSYLEKKKVYQSHSESFRVHSEFIPSHSDQLMVSKKKTFLPSQNAKFRPNSDQIPSQFWVHSESIPTKFRPNSDQILSQFRVNSESIPSQFRVNSESIPSHFRVNSELFLSH